MRPQILLLTYDKNTAPIYASALSNLGFGVRLFYDEDLAIDFLRQTKIHPDLIMADHMPALMNGILTTIEIRHIYSNARVLLMGENLRSRGFARQQGAIDLIRKPRSVEKFLCIAERYGRFGGNKESKEVRTSWRDSTQQSEIVISLELPSPKWKVNTRAVTPARDISSNIGPFPLRHIGVDHAKRVRRLKRNRNIVSCFFLLVLLSLYFSGNHNSGNTSVSEAMILANVHTIHIMETKNFQIFINGVLETSGYTGNGYFSTLTLNYEWFSDNACTVNVTAITDNDESNPRAVEMVTLSPGGIYHVFLYI